MILKRVAIAQYLPTLSDDVAEGELLLAPINDGTANKSVDTDGKFNIRIIRCEQFACMAKQQYQEKMEDDFSVEIRLQLKEKQVRDERVR